MHQIIAGQEDTSTSEATEATTTTAMTTTAKTKMTTAMTKRTTASRHSHHHTGSLKRKLMLLAAAGVLASFLCGGSSRTTVQVQALSLQSSAFHGRSLVVVSSPSYSGSSSSSSTSSTSSSSSEITMRKQKASDRRTRKRQRGEIEDDRMEAVGSLSTARTARTARTLTTSPMSAAGPWNHKQQSSALASMSTMMESRQSLRQRQQTQAPPSLLQQQLQATGAGAGNTGDYAYVSASAPHTSSAAAAGAAAAAAAAVVPARKRTPGRGRSRKRSTLYNSLAFYHNKFLILLTDEYQAEEDEVLGRIKASVDDPLALETAGYALYDLYAERRGNLFSDEVYRLTKAKDATTTYTRSIQDDFSPDSISSTARYLPANHKFSRNDVIMLTLQPNGSGDFFDPITTLPTSDKAVVTEARVLNMGPTYVDIAMPAGCFESTFGPAPNDASGSGDKRMRLRADRFFSDVPYRRMVDALAQITAIPDQAASGKKATSNTIITATATESDKKKAETKNKNPHENIVMDEVLREAILSTHAFTDIHSPLLRDPDVCDLEQVSNKLSKPPMATSYKLASQAVKYMKSNPHGVFRTFNAPQLASIEAALTRRMTMIQGPPGSGKTTVAAAIGFGFVHQCRTISTNAKVLACAFSNVGADNLAEAMIRLGLKVVRVGKPSAVSEVLWDCTLDAAIGRDEAAQKAIKNAARATTRLSKCSKGSPSTGALSERTLREVATAAVKASIQACNIAATKALREADVVVSTSTGAADPRLLAACGVITKDDEEKASSQQKSKSSAGTSLERVNAPDGLPPLSLPFVIVDEACQSVEPATLIPVTSTNSCRSLVMLGDPCQLPPTVRSGQSTPLSVSLMERLAATLPAPSVSSPVDNTLKDTSYLDTLPVKQAMSLMRSRERGERQQSSYRKRFAGSLLLSIQYRMHPSISAFPSAIFYDGLLATPSALAGQRSFPRVLKSLMPCGDPNICVRVIDVGGRGNERRGMPSGLSRTVFGSSAPSSLEAQTSYWNEPEAQRVVSLIKDVLADADPEVKTIGIVTPYNAQVQLIKGMIASDPDLQKLGQLPATIEVKSVDGYQGRERDLIIFSAVRSNRQGNIGFLHDWRRMNVGLTRAKSGLVVIGDLKTLSEADKYWDAFGKWATGVRCVVDDFDSPEDEPSL